MAGVAKIDTADNKPNPKDLNFSYSFNCDDYGSQSWDKATKQAINSGIQRVINVNPDGAFGSKSIAALAKTLGTDVVNAVAVYNDTLEAELSRVNQECSNRAAAEAMPPRLTLDPQPQWQPAYPYLQPQTGPKITPEQARLMDSVRATGRGAIVTGPMSGSGISIRSQRDGTTIIQSGEAAISVDRYGNKTPIDTPPAPTLPGFRRFPRH